MKMQLFTLSTNSMSSGKGIGGVKNKDLFRFQTFISTCKTTIAYLINTSQGINYLGQHHSCKRLLLDCHGLIEVNLNLA